MAKNKKKVHGSGKKPPSERPYVSDLELHDALAEKLTERELQALERQIRRAVEIATTRAVEAAVEAAYQRHWAISMRVLRDRFGWGKVRIRRLWDACIDYLHDMDDGLLTIQDMMDTLQNEDGIRISWSVKDGQK